MYKRWGVNMVNRSCHPAPPRHFTITRVSSTTQYQGTFIQGNIQLDPQRLCMQVGVKPSCLGSAGDPQEDRAGNHCCKDDWAGGEHRAQLSEGWDFRIEKFSFLFYVLQYSFGLLCEKIKIYNRKSYQSYQILNMGILCWNEHEGDSFYYIFGKSVSLRTELQLITVTSQQSCPTTLYSASITLDRTEFEKIRLVSGK